MDNNKKQDLDDALYQLWNNVEPDTDATRMARGRQRLERFIRSRVAARLIRRAAAVAAAAVVGLLLFWGGMQWQSSRNAAVPAEQTSRYVLLTSPGSVGEFELPDGSRLWLNADSRLEYTSDFMSGDRREVTLSGEAYFEVARDASRPFGVQLHHTRVEVLGTVFDARSYSGDRKEDVILCSGSVKVLGGKSGQDVTLRPNERYSYDPSSGKSSVSDVDVRSYCRWFEGKQVFDNVPLHEILSGIERRYNVEIILDKDLDPDKRLSMTVANEPLDEIMSVLCALLKGRYTHEDRNIVLSHK